MLAPFLDPTALALVIGGTALATALRSPAGTLRRALAALRTLARKPFTAEPLLERITAQARIARRNGVLALDRSVIDDPDIAAALAAIVDGADADAVARIVADRRRARIERHLAAADCWAGAAEAAPAMGMIGTLIGLARTFGAMDDPAAIGGAMAVALLATLYGALIANLVAGPVAARLRAAARTEAFERARLDAPLAALAAREAPVRVLASAA
ncbi:motility protein A [uncultured Sphingomonas sp.]|uniref:motility protein A n=1 Tax=uncultured Sphingomonas sp. TaxID=158754 RepID=UPI0035CA9E17